MKTTALLLACSASALLFAAGAHATPLVFGDRLTLNSGVATYDDFGAPTDIASGSYFGIDTNGDNRINGVEKIALAQGTEGLVIGSTSAPGANHGGPPLAGDTGPFVASWNFFGNTGTFHFVTAPTGGTDNGVDFSGLAAVWNAVPIAVSGDAWQPLDCASLGTCNHVFTDGVARLAWSGVYGDSYTLDFTGSVPLNDPSGFGGIRLFMHLEGRVRQATVPEPATPMLLAGVLLPWLWARHRQRHAIVRRRHRTSMPA